MVEIHCTNDGKVRRVKAGSTLLELAKKAYPEVTDPKTGKQYPTLAAMVDHKLKDLCFEALKNSNAQTHICIRRHIFRSFGQVEGSHWNKAIHFAFTCMLQCFGKTTG